MHGNGAYFHILASVHMFSLLQEKLMVLNHKAVAYLNLDVVVTGRGPAVAKASSSLFETIFKVSTKVRSHSH